MVKINRQKATPEDMDQLIYDVMNGRNQVTRIIRRKNATYICTLL